VSLRAARGLGAALAASVALLGVEPARAELWGYVDGLGTAHFAPNRVDARYSLVLGDAVAATPVPGKRHDPQRLITWMEIAPEVKSLQPLLREASLAHGVDAELLKAVIATESGFDGRLVSPKGARGLMQITPATADRYATRAEARVPAAQRLHDARINIHTGARMLADLQRRYGAIEVALAAWNAGEGHVRRHGGKVPPFAETRAHVHMVLELYWALLQRSQPARAMTLVAHTR
jgi:soluble lytic murein transglycosylase-like protein